MATLTLNEEKIIDEDTAKKFVELNKFERVHFDDVGEFNLSALECEEMAISILNSFECK